MAEKIDDVAESELELTILEISMRRGKAAL